VKDAHAFVTGASRGIGAAICEALLAEGVRVTAVARDAAAREARWAGRERARFGACDVTDAAAIDHAVGEAEAAFGPVAILINNAGGAETAPISRTDAEMLERMFRLNVASAFACTRRVLPAMKTLPAGRIVNIASTAGLTGYAYTSAYGAAKHAVVGLTRALAKELASTPVTVNAVCPSFTDTDLVARSLDLITEKSGRSREQALSELTANNPQGRLVRPEEVAHTVAWLCSDAAASVNGQAIAIDGGETA
jgi:NAD(P)-dependent dehydrogenase (short-subunit alcohol dehydrogenase family)